jgi:hypothetical protein
VRNTFNYRAFFIHDHPLQALPRPAPLPEAPAPGIDLLQCREAGSVAATWSGLHDNLRTLLEHPTAQPDFIDRLQRMEARALHVLAPHGDDSLFLLVQMLSDPGRCYSIVHAWLCAVLCRLVAPLCALAEDETEALTHAALTMNIAMTGLHLQLSGLQAHRVEPSSAQRELILAHPQQGVELLQQLGVTDPQWLRYVGDHHERADGTGYPAGKCNVDLPTRLLLLSDVFVGRISPRRYRAGIAAQQAMRSLCLDPSRRPDALGAALVRAIGVYVPGSHVLLANGESAVVMRRGRSAHTPLVIALLGPKGAPLAEPLLRDTAEAAFRVRCAIPGEEVRLRPSPYRLLAQVQAGHRP